MVGAEGGGLSVGAEGGGLSVGAEGGGLSTHVFVVTPNFKLYNVYIFFVTHNILSEVLRKLMVYRI